MNPLSIWLKFGHTVEIIRRLVPEFTELTGINVTIHVVPEDVAHDALVSGKNRPDVVTVPYWSLDELNARNVLRPITTAEFELNDGYFAAPALTALRRKETLWAVPHTLTGGVLSYRHDVFERFGVPIPRTLDDVIQSHTTLKTVGWGFIARCNEEFSSLETFAGWAAARDITLLPASGSPKRGEVVRGVGDLVAALCGGLDDIQVTELDYSDLGDLIVGGRASHLFDTSAWAFRFEAPGSPIQGRMSYTTLTDRSPAQFLYAEGLGITSWCANVSAAHRFIAWRHSERVLRAEVEEIRRIDIPRVDLRDRGWFRDFVHRARLEPALHAVDASWAQSELSHVGLRVDYVDQARRLMQALSGTISARYDSLDAAFEAIYGTESQPG